MRPGCIALSTLVAWLAGCGGGEAGPGPDGATPLHDGAPADGPVTPDPDAPVAACQGRDPQPLDSIWTVGGRDMRVHVPASYNPAVPAPLIINFHGLTMDGQQMEEISVMSAKADSAGFVVIYPDGSGFPQGWNAGDCCASASTSGIDDVAHAAAIIDEAAARLCLDERRVYATGFSNGGFLSHRLACELSDRITAIGPVAGVMGIDVCGPLRPVPIIHFHGTSDGIVPYGGGGFGGYRSVDQTITDWAARNGCTGAPTQTYQNGMVTCTTRGTCEGGVEVTLCSVDGGGHQWPGGMNFPGGGTLTMDISATDAMWEFFSRYALP